MILEPETKAPYVPHNPNDCNESVIPRGASFLIYSWMVVFSDSSFSTWRSVI